MQPPIRSPLVALCTFIFYLSWKTKERKDGEGGRENEWADYYKKDIYLNFEDSILVFCLFFFTDVCRYCDKATKLRIKKKILVIRKF